MSGRRELTPDDIRRLVFEAIGLIEDSQSELNLPICPNIEETRRNLQTGVFKATRLNKKRNGSYSNGYGAFEPPSTIALDSRLPFCDRPLEISQLPNSMACYIATREVIHADDYTGGNVLFLKTQRHILEAHRDKLERSMEIIEREGGCRGIECYEDLAHIWAIQYADIVAHYRAYVVLRHKKLPRLDFIWSNLQNEFFPPKMLTHIEHQRGLASVFEIITRKAGEYCLIDALRESESISEKNASQYTV